MTWRLPKSLLYRWLPEGPNKRPRAENARDRPAGSELVGPFPRQLVSANQRILFGDGCESRRQPSAASAFHSHHRGISAHLEIRIYCVNREEHAHSNYASCRRAGARQDEHAAQRYVPCRAVLRRRSRGAGESPSKLNRRVQIESSLFTPIRGDFRRCRTMFE